jgi:hypothetical protein
MRIVGFMLRALCRCPATYPRAEITWVSDLQNGVSPIAAGLRRFHRALAISHRNSGMFDVGSPCVGQFHFVSIALEKHGFCFALCSLNAPAQSRLSQSNPFSRRPKCISSAGAVTGSKCRILTLFCMARPQSLLSRDSLEEMPERYSTAKSYRSNIGSLQRAEEPHSTGSRERRQQAPATSDHAVDEFELIVATRQEPWRLMVQIAQCLGLRVSENAALQWDDFDFDKNKLLVQRSFVNGSVDDVKTEYSQDYVPLHPSLTGSF